jgi:hypothetical protein
MFSHDTWRENTSPLALLSPPNEVDMIEISVTTKTTHQNDFFEFHYILVMEALHDFYLGPYVLGELRIISR